MSTLTSDYRCYGVPTIRTDLPAPRIRRVDDRKNYGDESDAYGLVNPSVFSRKGVYEKDFLLPRSREEVRIKSVLLMSSGGKLAYEGTKRTSSDQTLHVHT